MTHDELAKMAYDNTVAFAAAPDPAGALKQAFDTHQVVFALFPDGSPRGWDKHIVKGKILIAGATDEQIAALSITAVPCTDMEEAMAMEKTFGDGKLH